MKLSDIVSYRNKIREYDLNPHNVEAVRYFNDVERYVSGHYLQFDNNAEKMRNNLADVINSINSFNNELAALEQHLTGVIEAQEPEYYQESTTRYETEMCFDTPEWILKRKLPITDDLRIHLQSRLKLYTDWRLPGMIIRPGLETFIEDLVPLDPLYLIDHDQALLDPAMNKFLPEYQRRLRPYVVKESIHNSILEKLPHGQFGLIFAYNFFNFKPIEVLQKWLNECYSVLRPGGVMIFTFNDCDYDTCIRSAEQHFQTFTPGRHVKNAIFRAGFEINYEWMKGSEVSWLEIKKPGEIVSLRGGQSLAKIVAKAQ